MISPLRRLIVIADAIARSSPRVDTSARTSAGDQARILAARIAEAPPAARPAAVAAVAGHLSPVQQGELLRTIDAHAPGPIDDIGQLAENIFDAIQHTLGGIFNHADAPQAPLGISKLLGPDTAKLLSKSPSLTADMKKLEADGWVVKFGPANGGTFADRTTKTITVDKNEAGNPGALVQSLAHEVGHARYTPKIDTSSKAAFLRSTLADEGAATLSNIRAQREILRNGGQDIGIAGNPANQKAYNAAYDKYLKDGDAAAARDTIGSIYGNGEHTSTTGQSYNDYYGSYYDKAYGHP
jgi:hypothetical protein